jgi:DNA topoisomerase I
MAIPIESFLKLESSLSKRLLKTWRQAYKKPLKRIVEFLKAGRMDAALAEIRGLSTQDIFTKNQDFIRYVSLAALMFGATRITDKAKDTVFVKQDATALLFDVTQNFEALVTSSFGEFIRTHMEELAWDMTRELEEGEVVVKFDPDQPRDEKGKWTDTGAGSQINTPEFKSWFGDSKVVDDKGKPLVVFHGSSSLDENNDPIDRFMGIDLKRDHPVWLTAIGDWFTGSPGDANFFARGMDGAVVYPVYLSLKNPFVVDTYEDLETELETRDTTVQGLRDALIKEGYDGIIIERSTTDTGNLRQDYVPFQSTQIKSAVGNRGTFDPKNPSIIKFDPDQPRDEKGRWTNTGAGGSLIVGEGVPSKETPVVLVFGGSFNPIHREHIKAIVDAKATMEEAGFTVHRSVVIPTAQKLLTAKLGDKALPLEDRTAMARLAVEEVSDIDVSSESSVEVENFQGKIRRTQLADWAKRKFPGKTVVAVTGEDAAPGHPPGFPSLYMGDKDTPHEGYVYLATSRSPDSMSSTRIRADLAAGKDIPSDVMNPKVLGYLKRRGVAFKREFDEAKHPRDREGRFTFKDNDIWIETGAGLWSKEGVFTESLGIERIDMPQIPAPLHDEFIAFAKDKSVVTERDTMAVSDLKPTQKHFNPVQVRQLPESTLDKALLISEDNYILDGTNRWVRVLQDTPDKRVKVIRLNVKVNDALALMKSFPGVKYKDISLIGQTLKSESLWEMDSGFLQLMSLFKFDPDQPRDEQGRWTDTGAGTGAGAGSPENESSLPTSRDKDRFKLNSRESIEERKVRFDRAEQMGFDTSTVWHHGTFTDFEEFQQKFANTDAYFGDGFYFSSSEFDVEMNYTNPDSPDQDYKIQSKIDQLQGEWDSDNPEAENLTRLEEHNDIVDRVTSEYDRTHAIKIDTFLRMEKPLDLTKDDVFFEITVDEDTGEISGLGADALAALEKTADEIVLGGTENRSYQQGQIRLSEELMEEGGLSSSRLFDTFSQIEEFSYLEPVDKKSVHAGQLFKDMVHKLGFDALIMNASQAFPEIIQEKDVKHAIVFNPNQIRSVAAKFNPTDKDSANILKYSPDQPRDEKGRWTDTGVNSQTSTPEFKEWFGDSKAVDEEGNPVVVYRGGIGNEELSPEFLEAQPREGYAVFASTSPYVSSSYANPDGDPYIVGAVVPLYIKADRLIEFPVGRHFDKFAFDRMAQRLNPGEVLVARGVYDIGPRASSKLDPKKLYSYSSDIYAWGRGTSVKSAVGNRGTFDPKNPSIIKFDPDQPRDEKGRWTDTGAGSQVDTPEFKEWFGDSKVVDAKGEPLVVYHGTDSDFSVFDYGRVGSKQDGKLFAGRGFYFSDSPSDASAYGGVTVPAYLKIEKPLDLRNERVLADAFINEVPEGQTKTLGELQVAYSRASNSLVIEDVEVREDRPGFFYVQAKVNGDWVVITTGMLASSLELSSDPTGFDFARSKLLPTNPQEFLKAGAYSPQQIASVVKRGGYDGVYGHPSIGHSGDIEYVVFYPTQIKSATGNRGTFDPKDPDITKTQKFDPDQPRNPAGSSEGGQWTATSGMAQQNGAWTRDGSPVPQKEQDRLRQLKVPPGWNSVYLNQDEDAALQAMGRDSKGRAQYIYSALHSEKAAAEKFARLQDFNKALPDIRKKISADMLRKDFSKEQRDTAAVLYLIDKTGFRIGSDADTKTRHRAYGASTLRSQHVKIDGDKIAFSFTGKKGVRINKTIHDGPLAGYLKERSGRLFDVTQQQVRDYMRTVAGSDFMVKDFRTWHGTAKALDVLKKAPIPKSEAAFNKLRREVAKKVAKHLGNTPAVALSAYIDPAVWKKWSGASLAKKAEEDFDTIMADFFETHRYDHTMYAWADLPLTARDPDDDIEVSVFKYDPDQPRHPAGTSQGGQFAPKGVSEQLELPGLELVTGLASLKLEYELLKQANRADPNLPVLLKRVADISGFKAAQDFRSGFQPMGNFSDMPTYEELPEDVRDAAMDYVAASMRDKVYEFEEGMSYSELHRRDHQETRIALREEDFRGERSLDDYIGPEYETISATFRGLNLDAESRSDYLEKVDMLAHEIKWETINELRDSDPEMIQEARNEAEDAFRDSFKTLETDLMNDVLTQEQYDNQVESLNKRVDLKFKSKYESKLEDAAWEVALERAQDMIDRDFQEQLAVYRGKNTVDYMGWDDLKPGDEINLQGFTSASTTLQTARLFGQNMMTILLPKGSQGVLLTSNNDEQEAIINHDAILRVLYRKGNNLIAYYDSRGSRVDKSERKRVTVFMGRFNEKNPSVVPRVTLLVSIYKLERILEKPVSFEKAVDDAAGVMAQLISSLHTSRLSAFGFTAEAEVRGLTQYVLTAQLDNRVCPICEEQDGKIFEVEDARDTLTEIVHTKDPDILRELQPWPKQDKDSVAWFKTLNNDQMVEHNWHIPPFHPMCRCLLVPTGEKPSIEDTPSFIAANLPEAFELSDEALHGATEKLLEFLNDLKTRGQMSRRVENRVDDVLSVMAERNITRFSAPRQIREWLKMLERLPRDELEVVRAIAEARSWLREQQQA